MRISQIIEFLVEIERRYGDLRLETITGLYSRRIPATGEKTIVAMVGEGRTIEDLVHEAEAMRNV